MPTNDEINASLIAVAADVVVTSANLILPIKEITQADYDALVVKSEHTIYVIVGA